MLAATPETTLPSNSSTLAWRPFSGWDEGLEPKAVDAFVMDMPCNSFLRKELLRGCTVQSSYIHEFYTVNLYKEDVK